MSVHYNTQESIVLRSSDDPDPTAGGYVEVELAIRNLSVTPVREGEGVEDWGGNRRGGSLRRSRFFFELLPLQYSAAVGTNLRTVGDLDKFVAMEQDYEYTWLYRVRLEWGEESSRFPYADATGNDYFFNLATDANPGILPHLVQIASTSRSPVEGGLITAELALESRGLD